MPEKRRYTQGVQHRRYRINYSPIRYEKDDIPDLFAAATREGMRTPTFARDTAVPAFRMEARDVHAVMQKKDTHAAKRALPQKPQRIRRVSPWFAMVSGMVVAGALILTLVSVAPESVIPQGTIARLIEQTLTATVIFSQ